MDQRPVRDRTGRGVRALARRLLGRVEGGSRTTRRSNPDAVVDCAVYVNGPGTRSTALRRRVRPGAARPRRLRLAGTARPRPGGARRGRPDLRPRRADRRTGARRRAPAHSAAPRAGHPAGPAHRRVRGARRADRDLRGGRHRGRHGAARRPLRRHCAARRPRRAAQVRADIERRPALLAAGPWAVAYAVFARMVDSYLEVAEHVERDLEQVEEAVFARDRTADIQHIYQLKREVVEFKRAVAAVAGADAYAARGPDGPPRALRRWFVDVDGRLSRAVERVTAYDDLLNSVVQSRLAQLAVDQNNDMRKIAAWAAIAAAQTAHRRHLRHELRPHARAGLALRLPGALTLMARRPCSCTGCSAAPAGCDRRRAARGGRGGVPPSTAPDLAAESPGCAASFDSRPGRTGMSRRCSRLLGAGGRY